MTGLVVEQQELVFCLYFELWEYSPVYVGTGLHFELWEGSAKLSLAQLFLSKSMRQLAQLSRPELHRGSALYY